MGDAVCRPFMLVCAGDHGAAMSEAQCAEAMNSGARQAREFAAGECKLLGFGEMGISGVARPPVAASYSTVMRWGICVPPWRKARPRPVAAFAPGANRQPPFDTLRPPR